MTLNTEGLLKGCSEILGQHPPRHLMGELLTLQEEAEPPLPSPGDFISDIVCSAMTGLSSLYQVGARMEV